MQAALRQDTHTPSSGGQEHWKTWGEKCSLFDNFKSASFEENINYMFKRFGFQFPNAHSLKDPKGLLQYLGAKLQYGHIALYSRGDDESARVFKSLHAVQRHMVDTGRCGMCYDGNEHEYEEFYDRFAATLLVMTDFMHDCGRQKWWEVLLQGAETFDKCYVLFPVQKVQPSFWSLAGRW
jgi:hypothetical protein